MKKLLSVAFIATILGLVGCDSSSTPAPIPDSPPPPPPPMSMVQVLHAVADAPTVDVSFDAAFVPPAGSPLRGIDFKGGTGVIELIAGDRTVQVDANLPDGTTTTVIPATPATFDEGMIYTIVAIGNVGAITPVILAQSDTVAAGSARARVLHAAPGAPPVDIFVTVPAADLAASAPIASLAFGEDAPPVEVAAGDYQIRATLVGDPATVVFDSGTVELQDGLDVFLAAVDNTTTSAAPITLAVLDGSEALEVLDIATEAAVRVVHASAAAGLVDVLADDAELFTDVAYATVQGFASVPAATYDVAVTPADMPMMEVVQADLALDAGASYTVIALNALVDNAPATVELLATSDDYRSVVTEAKVRLVHGAQSAGDVDIYLTAVGADLTMETPEATAVPFQADTGFGSVEAGMYDLSITTTETTDVLISATITLVDGGVYTAVARDPDPAVMMDTAGLILLDDFITP